MCEEIVLNIMDHLFKSYNMDNKLSWIFKSKDELNLYDPKYHLYEYKVNDKEYTIELYLYETKYKKLLLEENKTINFTYYEKIEGNNYNEVHDKLWILLYRMLYNRRQQKFYYLIYNIIKNEKPVNVKEEQTYLYMLLTYNEYELATNFFSFLKKYLTKKEIKIFKNKYNKRDILV